MPLTLDHEILTKDGWKRYLDVKKVKPGPDGKPVGENEEIVILDINNSSIITEKFLGDLYLAPDNKVMYDIKNDKIDITITEDTKFPYKFNLTDEIKINRLVKILYDMAANNLTKFYLATDNSNLSFIEINKTDLNRKIINVGVYSFLTSQNTFYVRRNNLECWVSY